VGIGLLHVDPTLPRSILISSNSHRKIQTAPGKVSASAWRPVSRARKSTIGSLVLNSQITNAVNASAAKIAAPVINDD
jgi:hypothetical protein